jgi:NADPH:quinone reductase-like Zn-dependent oxidoreductase
LAAYVATTVSIDDKRFVEMLGVDEVVVVDFRTDFRDFLYDYDYDAVFDTIGGAKHTQNPFRVA